MTQTEIEIVALLNKGYSYSQIQEILQVSSKTIASTKKAHFPSRESSNDALSVDAFQLNPNPPPNKESSITNISNNKQPHNHLSTLKTNKPMNEDYDEEEDEDDDDSLSPQALKKYKMQLDHELELEKLRTTHEEKSREQSIREMEIQMKQDEIDLVRKKPEDDKRNLLYRIKKVLESCEDGNYNEEEVEIMVQEARKVLSESEQYCHMNGITFQGSDSQNMLNKALFAMDEFLEYYEEKNEEEELLFDSAFLRLVKRATFQAF